MVKVSQGTRASGNVHWGIILMTTVHVGRPIMLVGTTFPGQGILDWVKCRKAAEQLYTGMRSPAAVHRHAIISDYGCKVITLSSYCHCDFLALKGCNLDL